MQSLSDSVALALPLASENADLQLSVSRARKHRLETEMRIGVGTVPRDIPLRVVGYAGLIARSIQHDIPVLVRQLPPVTLFSSVPKVVRLLASNAEADSMLRNAIRGLISLGSCMRMFGVENSITIELAEPTTEITDVEFDALGVDGNLVAWLLNAARQNASNYPWQQYATEHAARTMFSDVRAKDEPRRLIVFVGGRTEGPFWAIRRLVRIAVRRNGGALNDACGLILRRAKRPWYLPDDTEPLLRDVAVRSKAEVDELVKRAFDPNRGGNCGLKAELQRALSQTTNDQCRYIADSVESFPTSLHLAKHFHLEFGPRLAHTASTL